MKIDNDKLERIMAERCITAKGLSELTGVSQITISRIKRNIQSARPFTVGKIAKALNVPVESLLKQ